MTTRNYDLTRAGWNNKERVLNPTNVNARQFGKIFSLPIDSKTFAQTLILSNVNIVGGFHNIAIAATVNNTVYAFDADNGSVFWSKNFTPSGLRVVINTDFAKCNGLVNTDIPKQVGIIGTPVIDSVTQTLYFVARATDAPASTGVGNYYTYLHAVDIKTGDEKTNSPVLISGSVNGTSSDAVNGLVPFDPQHQNQRPGLALYNGTIFIGFSSHCDWLPYHGWIFGYDATTLARKLIYCTTPDGMGGGIWESGTGLAIDEQGYMYIVTGNVEGKGIGTEGDPFNLEDRAQSAVKLKITDTALIPVDFFTPSNYQTLDGNADLDYGSMASFLMPNSNLYFTGAKDGNIYILNTNDMGNLHPSGDQIAQVVSLGTGIFMRCQPAYYGSSEHEFAYVWSEQSQLKAIPFDRNTNSFDLSELKTGLVSINSPSANISTSSNGFTDGTGIVWINRPADKGSQMLVALDANDITKELWNSTLNINRDSCGGFMKFAVPTVANGKVYLANGTGFLNVYGIIDSTSQLSNCSASSILSNGISGFASSGIGGHASANAFDLNSGTQWISNTSSTEWLGANLGSIDSICSVSVQWDSTGYATDFLLQVSNDSTNWTTLNTITGNNSTYNSYSINATGKYMRIYCTTGLSGAYSIREFTVYGRVPANCETPPGLTVNMIDTSSAVIRWKPIANATAYKVGFKSGSSSLWQFLNAVSDSLYVSGLSCAAYYQYKVQTNCNLDSSLTSQIGEFNTLACNNCILPTRVYQTDIGDVGLPGLGCFFDPSTYTINASGTDIGDTADAFHFVYKDFDGDGTVKARIMALDAIDSLNKAGVMFREDLSADARFVFIGVTSSKKIVFINRQFKKDSVITSVTTGYSIPCYVKIVKKGQKFSGYVSTDNKTWVLVGSGNNQMSFSGIYIGLAVTSHNNTELSNAKFSSFTYSSTVISCGPLPTGVKSGNVGNINLNGDACYYSYNRYVINGSGTTIGNQKDSFFYVYQTFTGNKSVRVEVTSQDTSNPYNKAGIMVRFAMTPDARNVFVGLTSGNGAFFQYRNKKNNVTKISYIPNIKAPYYLKLEKSNDSVYSGYISPDNVTWQKIGEVVILPQNITKFMVGMAVTSNDSTKLSNVVFDNWNIADISNSLHINSDTNSTYAIRLPDLKIYPNPADKSFSVDFNLKQKVTAMMPILGISTGRVVHKENLLNFAGGYRKSLTNALVPKENYSVALKTSNGLLARQPGMR